MPALVLRKPESAAQGLEHYGSSLKGAILAFVGGPFIPVVGPIISLVMVMVAWSRFIGLLKIRRSGLGSSGLSHDPLRLAWWLNVAEVSYCTPLVLVIAHDSSSSSGPWVSGNALTPWVGVWLALIVVELVAGHWLASRMAKALEVAWIERLQLTTRWVLGCGLAVGGVLATYYASSGVVVNEKVTLALITLLGIVPCSLASLAIGDNLSRFGMVAGEMEGVEPSNLVIEPESAVESQMAHVGESTEASGSPSEHAATETPPKSYLDDDSPIPLD